MTAETLFEPPVETDRAAGRLTARALRRSLLPLVDLDAAASELAAAADRRRRPILTALQRIERASSNRPSAVLDRAQLLLWAALQRLDTNVDVAA